MPALVVANMQRRRFLAAVAASCPLLATGCLSDGAAGQAGTDSPEDTDSPTPTPESESTTEEPTDTAADDGTHTATDAGASATTISDTSFEVLDSGCGQQRDEASIMFEDGEGVVSVSGTIWGNDMTYTATLDSTAIEGDALVITVAAEQKSESAVGGQCIVEINYEASVTLDGDLPAKAEVRHRHGDETKPVAETDC